MKALRKLHAGKDGVQLCEVPIPEPAADEIRVKVVYVGICGTDMHIIDDEYAANMPVTMGHEFSGIVDSVGADVESLAAGDRVIAMTVGYSCGKCKCCRHGFELKCPDRKSIGSGMDGAMAEYVVVKADRAFKIPDGVPLEIAALAEPISCCARSVIEVSSIKAGDYIYVSGPGIMGQIVAQLAHISGAHVTVGGTGRDNQRLALAKKLGADVTVDITSCDIYQKSMEITHGEGYDVVFECAGVQASVNTCMCVLRNMGEYVQVCLFGKDISFPMDAALIGEKHIVNSFAAERSSFELTLRLLESNRLLLRDYISKIYPLADWEQAVKEIRRKNSYKILLKPGDVKDN